VRTNPAAVEALWLLGRLAWIQGDVARAQELLEAAHAAAAQAPVPANVFDEDTTRTGSAQLSQAGRTRQGELNRWRTLRERVPDAAGEYATPVR
jgi:hypothetical protein